MHFSTRRVLLGLSVVIAAAGVMIGVHPEARVLAWLVAACGLLSILAINALLPPLPLRTREPDDVLQLEEGRLRELVRGTSLYLREMRYRYSVRFDPGSPDCRECFTADVNGVRLGFVSVVIMDNESDRQGRGYVAFVHDGRRWRGPGLPCPAGREQAVAHAARCVSPMDAAPGVDAHHGGAADTRRS
jgi:hypothetical protein